MKDGGSGFDRLAGQPRGGKGTEWPDPHPLPNSLLPVAVFDPELAPDKTRPWIADVCERMQCPQDFVAASTMAALGSMIGRKVTVGQNTKDAAIGAPCGGF